MNFLYPEVLWGLTALSIPIIIHLFNFRKAKKIFFSNVRFLEDIKKKSSSKLKLKHLLILASRLLFLFFLVLVFAQPFLPGNDDGFIQNSATIYLDNSQSMSNLTQRGVSGFNESLDYANQIIDLYPATTQFKIVTGDFMPSGNHTKSPKKAKELITEIDYSNDSRSGQSIMDRLAEFGEAEASDIFLISDFQATTIGNFQKLTDTINDYKLIPIQFSDNKNVFVDSIFLASPILVNGQRNQLHVKLRNTGSENIHDLIVKFYVNERQAASASIDIDSRASATLIFELNFDLDLRNSCRINFEDFPITFDNDYHFTINRLEKIKIVEIIDENRLTYLDKVFENNELFQYQKFQSTNISYDAIATTNFLIINEITNFDQTLTSMIQEQILKGTAIFVIPAEDVNLAAMSRALGLNCSKDEGPINMELETPDINNPFFDGIFSKLEMNTRMPFAKTTLSWPDLGMTLIKTKTGTPFLTHFSNDQSLYLLASPLNEEYTDLPIHAIFVPIMYRMALMSHDNLSRLSYTTDESNLVIAVDSIPLNKLYTLQNADQELIPTQKINANQLVLNLPKYLLSPGFYDLTIDGRTQKILAFNNAKSESFPDQLGLDALASKVSGNVNVEIIADLDPQSFTDSMKEKYHSIQLWKYALILSLMFLVAETLLLRFL